ncbi:MAG: LPS export ABC transporter ATP-binding protein [Candidatus Saccharicenans sp.]|jgi:lipopolysaccharide export system ATP-binding protein|nr:LPS export ABC transporter ATP-binding protein [Candidatus Saccharicenans sp.]
MNLLEVKNLVKRYGQRLVLDHVSLRISQKEVVGLLGPNGAGKTTAFSVTIGLVRQDSGQVLLNDEELTPCPVYIRVRKGLGFLPQDDSIFRGLTVEQNLWLAAEAKNGSKGASACREEIRQQLEEFGLLELAGEPAGQLSGGERRKLEIVRAMILEPQFLLLDEPFSELDPKAVAELQQVILKLKEKKVGLLLTDHRAQEALKILDRIYIINEGKILFEGRPEEVLKENEIRKIYFGPDFRL